MTSRFQICIIYFIILLGNPTEFLDHTFSNLLICIFYFIIFLRNPPEYFKLLTNVFCLFFIYSNTFIQTAIINYFIGSEMW